jgi:pimeloyl-ACP methyl ester carboxylesterase
MSTITTKDGTTIYDRHWGPKDAQPVVFHYGWPLSSDDWDAQMLFFVGKGYRVVAHDRRGHGRSTQVGDGHDMDHYAAVVEHLDLRNAVHVGHSTGGGAAIAPIVNLAPANVLLTPIRRRRAQWISFTSPEAAPLSRQACSRSWASGCSGGQLRSSPP